MGTIDPTGEETRDSRRPVADSAVLPVSEDGSSRGLAAERAVYLYCLALADRVPEPGPPLFLVRQGAVVAVVKEVPLAEFSGPEAEERARELAWIGPRALEHNGTVERVWESSPVLPLPFATLYSSPQALSRFLKERVARIAKFLARVDGAAEWSVKGLLDRNRAVEELVSLRAREAGAASASPGLRYIQERKWRREGDQVLLRRVKKAADEIRRALSEYAFDFRERQALATEDEPGREMIFNWAWLLRDEYIGDFVAAAERLNALYGAEGVSLRMSGPLPPYSFVPCLTGEGERGRGAEA